MATDLRWPLQSPKFHTNRLSFVTLGIRRLPSGVLQKRQKQAQGGVYSLARGFSLAIAEHASARRHLRLESDVISGLLLSIHSDSSSLGTRGLTLGGPRLIGRLDLPLHLRPLIPLVRSRLVVYISPVRTGHSVQPQGRGATRMIPNLDPLRAPTLRFPASTCKIQDCRRSESLFCCSLRRFFLAMWFFHCRVLSDNRYWIWLVQTPSACTRKDRPATHELHNTLRELCVLRLRVMVVAKSDIVR